MKYEEELTEDEKAFINEPLVKKVTRTVMTDETVLVVQTVEFRRQAEVDSETCDTTYGNWEPENGIWEKYEIPVRKGYRPSIGMVEPETVTPDTENITVSVSYRAVKKLNRQKRKRKNFTPEELAELAKMGENIPVKKNTDIQSDKSVIKDDINPLFKSKNKEDESKDEKDERSKKMKETLDAVLSENKHSAEDSSLNKDTIGTENSEEPFLEKSNAVPTSENSENTGFKKAQPVKTSKKLSTGVRHAAADKYQKKLFKDKMKRHRSMKRRRSIDIADTSNFSDETLKLLDEFKVIGEETLLRGKWKVKLFTE